MRIRKFSFVRRRRKCRHFVEVSRLNFLLFFNCFHRQLDFNNFLLFVRSETNESKRFSVTTPDRNRSRKVRKRKSHFSSKNSALGNLSVYNSGWTWFDSSKLVPTTLNPRKLSNCSNNSERTNLILPNVYSNKTNFDRDYSVWIQTGNSNQFSLIRVILFCEGTLWPSIMNRWLNRKILTVELCPVLSKKFDRQENCWRRRKFYLEWRTDWKIFYRFRTNILGLCTFNQNNPFAKSEDTPNRKTPSFLWK